MSKEQNIMQVLSLSRVWLFATPWSVMEFSRQEYWSRLPFLSPGDLPDPGVEPGYPALEANFFYHLSYQGCPKSTKLWGKKITINTLRTSPMIQCRGTSSTPVQEDSPLHGWGGQLPAGPQRWSLHPLEPALCDQGSHCYEKLMHHTQRKTLSTPATQCSQK